MPMIIGGAIVLILVIALVAMRGNKSGTNSMLGSGSQTATESIASVQELVQKVAAKGVPVKENEIPVVAQIKDVASLKNANPAFYKDAQNGDLIYIWSDRVALFSNSQDKVLQLMALLPDSGQVTPQTVPIVLTPGESLAAEAATVEVRNGARTGLGKAVSDKLTGANITALAATDAGKQEARTLIMPTRLDRPLGNTLKTIKDLTGGDLVPPNQSFAPFKGDVLVIVGANYKP